MQHAQPQQNSLTITQPDDWHIHLRDGAFLERTVRDASQQFARAIVMPNLVPPITTVKLAKDYRTRILAQRPPGRAFQPLMTLYLTDHTSPAMIDEAKKSGIIFGCKLYPAGATTHSDSGVTHIKHIYPALAQMQQHQLPLQIHGEVTDSHIDVFDREAVFIETILKPIVSDFPKLPIILEHITTRDAVEFVRHAPNHVAATITAHHLLLNRNDMLVGGIKPHYYCLPILKRNIHQQALRQAATSGNPKFFLGTDSAPHTMGSKESACGCAGIYTAHAAIELYAEVFESMDALAKLEGFASFYGADFYGLSRNKQRIQLSKQVWHVAEHLTFGDDQLRPFRAGEQLSWRIDHDKPCA